MADLVAVAFIVVLCVVAACVATAAHNHAVRSKVPWRLEEHPTRDGNYYVVSAVRPGDSPIVIGEPIACADGDFEGKLEEVRSEGRMRLAALNSGLKADL